MEKINFHVDVIILACHLHSQTSCLHIKERDQATPPELIQRGREVEEKMFKMLFFSSL